MNHDMAKLAAIALLLCMAVMAGLSLGGIRRMPARQMKLGIRLLRWANAALIGADVGALLLLTYRLALGSGLAGSAVLWCDGLFACDGLLGAVLLFFFPPSLFPEDSGALALIDRVQLRRFTACLWRLLAKFSLCGGWMALLLFADPFRGAPGMARAALCLSAASVIWALWDGRQSIRISYERIEAMVDKQYQAELLNFMQVIRSQRHDFNFHLNAVAGMIQNGRYQDCDQYISEMVRHTERLNDVLPIKNPVISALINTFQELASGKKIDLRAQSSTQLEGLPCTMYEFNSILGNLLQNAIDEVEQKPAGDRWAELLLLKRGRQYIIRVTNPCDRDPSEFENVFNPGYSTKQSHEGIGLATVRKIAAKYGGAVHAEHAPGVVRFIVRLPALSVA